MLHENPSGGDGEEEKNSIILDSRNETEHCIFFHSGLCAVYRSEAGHQAPSDEEEEGPQARRSYLNNSHWLSSGEGGGGGGGEEGAPPFAPQPSKKVAYYDAASLYPSSGKCARENPISSAPLQPGKSSKGCPEIARGG